MEDNMEILLKTRKRLPYVPRTPLLSVYPEKTITEKRSMYPKVHCSTIYNT